MASKAVIYLAENDLIPFTDWREITHALEQAFLAVSSTSATDSSTSSSNSISDEERLRLPRSSQPARTFVHVGAEGALLCMPAFLGNHSVCSATAETGRTSTLACKLITSFKNNPQRDPPLPDIMGNIFLFDEVTGQLQAILEANYLTGLRTAAASIVATEQVFLSRTADQSNLALGIVGTGVQGEFHAIGFMHTHSFAQIRLWNRTKERSERLRLKLEQMKASSRNPQVVITVHDSAEECCKGCDIIVTATSSPVPVVYKSYLKENVHINAIGSGLQHHTELAQNVYDESRVFIDYWSGAKAELATLKSTIVGEVGQVLLKRAAVPSAGITVFQSLGMAVEDAAIGKLFYTKYLSKSGSGCTQ